MILTEYEQIEARARYGVNDILLGLTGWAQANGRDAMTVKKKALGTFDLGVGGATPSSPASLLNAVIGIRWPSSGAFAVLAAIRDLGS